MSGLPDRPVVLPSLMSADMLRLGEQLDALIAAGTSAVHVDVMDLALRPEPHRRARTSRARSPGPCTRRAGRWTST